MHNVYHRNILHMGALLERSVNLATTFVEPCDGVLEWYIREKCDLADSQYVVPSTELQDIIRQIVEGIDVLRGNGCYHGDFRLLNTYYSMENGSPIVKLANFKFKGLKEEELHKAQVEDWCQLGDQLEKLSVEIISKNQYYVCTQINHLAQLLKSSLNTQPDRMKNIALSHVFFWDKERRNEFFTYGIPKLLANPEFKEEVDRNYKCQMPWNCHDYHGLLQAMDAYRINKFGSKYDGAKKVHHLSFVSGCYTHEEEIKGFIRSNLTVDEIFQQCEPDMCLKITTLPRKPPGTAASKA